jgi:NSS family neurotransmitter:Na+ symporter
MGMVGHVVGLFFFIALAVGAVTSAIALLEVVTASVIDEFGLSRRTAALGTATVIALLGILPATNLDLLGLADKIAGELMLVAGVLVISILAGWVLRSEMVEELSTGASPFWKRQIPRIVWVLRWFVPPVIVIVLLFSVKETIAAIGAFLNG